MGKSWNKLKSWGRHDKHNELVKTSFHAEPNNGESYDEYTLWTSLSQIGEKKYSLSFDIKLVAAVAAAKINVIMNCTYFFNLETNEEPFIEAVIDDEAISYLISPYMIAVNFMIDEYNNKRGVNPITKDMQYPTQHESLIHIQTLKKAKIGQKPKLN